MVFTVLFFNILAIVSPFFPGVSFVAVSAYIQVLIILALVQNPTRSNAGFETMRKQRGSTSYVVDCKEISIDVFSEKELRGLSPNFHIHVYVVSDLNIATFGPPTFLQQSRQTDQGNIQIAHVRNMNARIGTVTAQYLF